jgi:hypothetical protein
MMSQHHFRSMMLAKFSGHSRSSQTMRHQPKSMPTWSPMIRTGELYLVCRSCPEPWYYGHLWTHGSLLKASAAVVCAILLIIGGIGFLISIALPTSGSDGSAVGIMTVVKIVGAAIYFLFVGAIRFTLRIVAASVLLKVDSARNIRGTYFAMRYAHFVGPFGD